MTEAASQTLVHLSTNLVGGTLAAQSVVAKLLKIGKIVSSSSVYKRYLSSARVDIYSNIEVVFRFKTECAADELLWHFRQYSAEKKEKLQLLVFDELVVLAPQITLPNPSLHTDLLVVRCAAEAWPDYEHPIIQKSLREIAAQSPPPLDSQFFLQGKTLVDF